MSNYLSQKSQCIPIAIATMVVRLLQAVSLLNSFGSSANLQHDFHMKTDEE